MDRTSASADPKTKFSLQRSKFEFNCGVKDKRQIGKMDLDAGM